MYVETKPASQGTTPANSDLNGEGGMATTTAPDQEERNAGGSGKACCFVANKLVLQLIILFFAFAPKATSPVVE